MTNREAAQKIYFLIDQWLTDFHKAEWMAKVTGRTRETWQTFGRSSLFHNAEAFPTSEMIFI